MKAHCCCCLHRSEEEKITVNLSAFLKVMFAALCSYNSRTCCFCRFLNAMNKEPNKKKAFGKTCLQLDQQKMIDGKLPIKILIFFPLHVSFQNINVKPLRVQRFECRCLKMMNCWKYCLFLLNFPKCHHAIPLLVSKCNSCALKKKIDGDKKNLMKYPPLNRLLWMLSSASGNLLHYQPR